MVRGGLDQLNSGATAHRGRPVRPSTLLCSRVTSQKRPAGITFSTGIASTGEPSTKMLATPAQFRYAAAR